MNKEETEKELKDFAQKRGFCRPTKKWPTDDYKGEFYLLPSTEGRKNPVTHGYGGQHHIKDNWYTSSSMRIIGKDVIWPGESGLVYATLLSPSAFEGKLKPGDIIDVCEGARKVGEVKILEIFNPSLGKCC